MKNGAKFKNWPGVSTILATSVMSQTRFETIRSALHFSGNEETLYRSDPLFDRALKVRPLIDHFNRCFQAARSASKQQSINEHMIKFKGHNILRQYIRNKPIKWRFKLWCRCDAVSGYLYQFDLYTGRKTHRVQPRRRCGCYADKVTGTALMTTFSTHHCFKSRCLRRKSTCVVQFKQTESIC